MKWLKIAQYFVVPVLKMNDTVDVIMKDCCVSPLNKIGQWFVHQHLWTIEMINDMTLFCIQDCLKRSNVTFWSDCENSNVTVQGTKLENNLRHRLINRYDFLNKINLEKIELTIDSLLFCHPSKALPSSLSETFEVNLKTLTFHDKEINKKLIYRHLFTNRKIFLNFILKKKYQVNINLTSFQHLWKVFPSRSKEF